MLSKPLKASVPYLCTPQVPLQNVLAQHDAHILYTEPKNYILYQQRNQRSLASETKPNNPKLHCYMLWFYVDSEAWWFLMSLSKLLMCKRNWDVQAVQLRQEAVILPCSLGAMYCYLQGMSQYGGKHTEIHHKHQVINFLALDKESISSSSELFACVHLVPGILLCSRGFF